MTDLGNTLQKSRLRARYRLHLSLTNASSRRGFQRHRPALTEPQQHVLETLRDDGLAMVPFAELVHDDELWQALCNDVASFRSDAERIAVKKSQAGKRSKAIRARETKNRRHPNESWLRYALSDAMLGVVNTYLALWTKLTYVDTWYTPPSPPDAPRISAQRWHRDPEDSHLVKAFTYFTDVDQNTGALEYVRGSIPGSRYGDLWPWRAGSDREGERYPPDGELERLVAEQDRLVASGPAGTIVFCDTAGFHRGGFGSKLRVVAPLTYVSPASLATSLTTRKFKARNVRDLGSPAARFAIA